MSTRREVYYDRLRINNALGFRKFDNNICCYHKNKNQRTTFVAIF